MFAALLVSLSLAVVQQAGTEAQQEPEVPTEPAVPAEEPVDEITAYADDTIMNLRRKLRGVDEKFFARYNELNSNDDFDMICKRETRIGSQIPRQVCYSRLHRARRSEAAEDVLDGDVGLGDDSVSWTRRHYKAVREDIRLVLGKDEELRDIVRDRKRLLAEIDRRKAED